MSLAETRFGVNVTGLPTPTVLPSFTAALSRRAALFGAVTVVMVTAAIQAASDDVDRRLTAMAADICTTLDGAAYAFDEVRDEADQDRRVDRVNRLTPDIIAIPAISLPGVLAKAKAYLDSNSYDVLHLSELADSLAEDVERVLGRLS